MSKKYVIYIFNFEDVIKKMILLELQCLSIFIIINYSVPTKMCIMQNNIKLI